MQIHQQYGPSASEKGWVPAPRFLLRRDRILRFFRNQPTGALLEIGCGAGTIVREMAELGFECTAMEGSQNALDLARFVNDSVTGVEFCGSPGAGWSENFDYVTAYEVLEHIEDDSSALKVWRSWLKTGGLLVGSVPAHESKWTATDEWAGHFRRYERDALRKQLVECGFTVLRLESYGFPLANMIEPIRARTHARQLAKRQSIENAAMETNTALSGVERSTETKLYPLLCSLPGRMVMRSAVVLQNIFSNVDIGNGYIFVAQRD